MDSRQASRIGVRSEKGRNLILKCKKIKLFTLGANFPEQNQRRRL